MRKRVWPPNPVVPWLLLKGADTVVATADGRGLDCRQCAPRGSPQQRSIGGGFFKGCGGKHYSAGILPRLRGPVPAPAAVWLRGGAAYCVSTGLIAEDLSEVLPEIYRRLFDRLQQGA